MLSTKKEHPQEKTKLHARNRHRERYNFAQLTATCPALATYVKTNDYGDESIDFFNAEAVKMLNKALLQHFYDIQYWEIPPHYLCSPIPGRADYIHHIAEHLGSINNGKIPMGAAINCLDIGVGSNCVYPIIGRKEYGWSFVGSDIDAIALQSATKIAENNPILKEKVEFRLQENPKDILHNTIKTGERFDLTICNPPFHASAEEAQAGNLRKINNLKGKKLTKPSLNFGGTNTELWCDGGEQKFIHDMILQSEHYATACLWFSTIVSKESTLDAVYQTLRTIDVYDAKVIPMGQGNKKSRVLTWTFLDAAQQKTWVDMKWK
jgi:23S rRNA (adenine1618-N6)-methyltransferase